MKKMFLMFCILLIPELISAIEIHQIYYDPVNSESGGEAVEFYNPNPFDVDVSGWTIATESSLQDAVLPANTTVPAEGYFLVADSMWDERKDNINWRSADFMTPITLNNDDSGVALINSTGHVVDAVGWGDVAGISNNLFSGTPCPDAPQGKALLRVNGTNDNSNDFIATDPDFFGDNIIPAEVNVSASIESSAYILEGGSIMPSASRNKTIHVRAGEQLSATLFDVTKTMDRIDNTTYEARFVIPYFTHPGNYSIFFSDNTELRFEIKGLKSFKVEAERIVLNVLPGSSSSASNKAVIKNTGNLDLIFSLDLITDSLEKSFFRYSLNKEDYESFDETFELPAGQANDLYFKIEIPSDTGLGSYHNLIAVSPKN